MAVQPGERLGGRVVSGGEQVDARRESVPEAPHGAILPAVPSELTGCTVPRSDVAWPT